MAEFSRTVAATIAGNVRTYRQLRSIEQGVLARHMQKLGIPWRQVTVSEVERNQRNVTVTELVALTLALRTTIEQLLDTRGPEGIRGPRLSLIDVMASLESSGTIEVEEGDEVVVSTLAIRPQDVTALVCPHKAYQAVDIWGDDGSMEREPKFIHEELRR